jgi:hypothetical protein
MSKTTIPTGGIADDAVTAAKATGFGKIGQVLQVTTKTETATNSTSFVDCTNMSLNITPSATSSKILAIANVAGLICAANDTDAVSLRILRDSTEVSILVNVLFRTNDDEILTCVPMTALDSPSSTSQLTYKIQVRNRQSNNVSMNGSGDSDTSLTLIEVLA